MVLNKKEFCKLAEQDKIRLFIPMSKLDNAFGILFFKTSSDKKDMVECVVDKYHSFEIKEGYKITARALNEEYGTENYYVSDLLQMIESGYIKAKINLN